MNATAKRIVLKTRKQVFGEMLGNNSSLFQGEGFEFSELREYVYGDDVRKIDWKTTAKLHKPYVKIYHEERELNVVVSTMFSGSTAFGTKRPKRVYMVELLSILGFASIKNSDLFSSIIYADRLYSVSRPSKKLFSVSKEVENALSFEVLNKEADYKGWSETLYQRVKKRSLMFLIGDFVGDVDLRLLSRKHDLFVIIVRDHFEEHPESLGYLRLVDPESGTSMEGDINSSVMAEYRKEMIANDRRLYKHLRKNGIRYIKLYTDEDPFIKLTKSMR